MGKTSLVRAFLDEIAADAHVLQGASDDLITQRPLGPVWDMSYDSPELANALAEGTEAVYDIMMGLLNRSLRPTVIVFEDVHWADNATLDLIRYLGRRIVRTHGLMLLTYRDEEVATDHPLRFIMSDLPVQAIARLALEPLSGDAIRSLAGKDLKDVDRIHRDSGGNPFYATELIGSPSRQLPASIVDSVHGRVARLDSHARELTELVSVVPGRAELWLVENQFANWAKSLDAAEQSGVLVRNPADISFRHELARKAVESSLTTSKRIELNRSVLACLLDRNEDITRILHHAVEAADVSTLLAKAPGAARRALALGSNAEAVQHFHTIADHYMELPERERALLLEDWSYAAHIVNLLPEATLKAEEAIALWRAIAEPLGLGRALRWRSRIAWLAGDRAAAKTAITEAIAVLEPLGPTGELAYAYSSQSQLSMLKWDHQVAVAQAERAIEIADQVGDLRIRSHAMVNLGSARSFGPSLDVADLEAAIHLAAEIGYWDEVFRGSVNIAWAYLSKRQLDLAEERARETAAICEAHELRAMRDYATGTLSKVLRFKGQWAEAEDLLTDALSHSDLWGTNEILNRTELGTLLMRRGDSGADEQLERAWELAVPTDEVQRTGPVAAALAERAWLRNDLDELEAVVVTEIERATAVDAMWFAGDVAMWAWRNGLTDFDTSLLPDPPRLLIEGNPKAAAVAYQAVGMIYEAALALTDENETAAQGLRVIDKLGADAVGSKIRKDLRDRGISNVPQKAKGTRIHPFGLTPRQAEVVDLIAEGLTNAEIADRLFVSSRTVDHHVSAVLRKLGVSTRSDAIRAFPVRQ